MHINKNKDLQSKCVKAERKPDRTETSPSCRAKRLKVEMVELSN